MYFIVRHDPLLKTDSSLRIQDFAFTNQGIKEFRTLLSQIVDHFPRDMRYVSCLETALSNLIDDELSLKS